MAGTTQGSSMDCSLTTVIDAGGRYGMHPSWKAFGGALRYFAFEPDMREAQRLREQTQPPGYEVIDWGLSRTGGPRVLRVPNIVAAARFLK